MINIMLLISFIFYYYAFSGANLVIYCKLTNFVCKKMEKTEEWKNIT